MYAQFVFERLLQSTGKTVYTMITQSLGAVINIVLDPIFIFGYFGVPRMGVAGAAVATVIGQIVAGTAACIINLKANTEIHFRIKGFRPDGKIIGLIYEVGIPSIIMQSIGSVMTYGMNKILLGFSSTAAAVFGVYFKLQSFIFMPVFGQMCIRDRDETMVEYARQNARLAGVDHLIHFQKRGVDQLSHSKKYGFVITNPPYGERLEEKEALFDLYHTIGERFKKLDDWSLYLITSYDKAQEALGLKADKNRKIYNGMMKTYFYQFPGPKPPKKNP